MKYRTFVKVVTAAIIAVVVVIAVAMSRGCAARQAQPLPPPMAAPAAGAPDPNAGNTAATGQPAAPPARPELAQAIGVTVPLTDIEKEILNQQQSPLTNGEQSGDTRKWVVTEPGFRAEFRADTGKGAKYWNRVKVAYTGDRGFSERWDFKQDGSVKRRVDPDGSGKYTQEYRLKDGAWLRTK